MVLRTNTWLVKHKEQEVFCHGQIKLAGTLEIYCNDPNGDKTLIADELPDEARQSWHACVRYITDELELSDVEELYAL